MSETKTNLSVGFIGSGMMASAIMDGLIANKVVEGPESITCSDVFDEPLERARAKGIHTTKSNVEVCEKAKDAIIVAVKPDTVTTICKDIMAVKQTFSAVIISVAAGVTLETLEHNLPGRRVVRVMPNTACTVGQSASGYALGALGTDEDRIIVKAIFGSCGMAHEIKEFLLNAVTGLSGSGPAYVFEFIEALADGGVRVGLPREEAVMLAAQTVKGAAEMVLTTGQHPGLLKDRVCSPGGTTIAGVEELEKGGVRAAAIQAVKAATRRSMQLGGIPESDITSKYNL
uniref:Pyrroline-5-carboxylate reductase n=1 Tax=Entomoneis paludosa TaxID=265537 RepID=A0A7S2VER5_9STRA|mmetsp:Transcript_1742/g.3698  ORF Transcript_1742/g.3698 Transcript_1742/m.3698 type:complete len:287 (+) Transcript_1742:46-906(+)|eukprot:CAMPEP_0172447570 /NCGR_PEP_ID=MMETSP1065-20121228/6856_1 /TAXON_ID=265537 /ORGANISM="Amphiprora paludosa, Strain CCMP125" /LENGTH=286 /DNA_ID=CAMNT_0013198903 /DNA_START=101 /DNA_END=961 /DNA_ORIENTATION=-